MKIQALAEYSVAPLKLDPDNLIDRYQLEKGENVGEPERTDTPGGFGRPAQPFRSGNQYTVPSTRLRKFFNAGEPSAPPEAKTGAGEITDPAGQSPLPNLAGEPPVPGEPEEEEEFFDPQYLRRGTRRGLHLRTEGYTNAGDPSPQSSSAGEPTTETDDEEEAERGIGPKFDIDRLYDSTTDDGDGGTTWLDELGVL